MKRFVSPSFLSSFCSISSHSAHKGLTPIQVAAHIGDLPCVRCLVEHGADPFRMGEWHKDAHLAHKSASEIASMHGHDDIVAYFGTLGGWNGKVRLFSRTSTMLLTR